MIVQILRREVRPGEYEVIVQYASGRSRTYKPGDKISRRALDYMYYHKPQFMPNGTIRYK